MYVRLQYSNELYQSFLTCYKLSEDDWKQEKYKFSKRKNYMKRAKSLYS